MLFEKESRIGLAIHGDEHTREMSKRPYPKYLMGHLEKESDVIVDPTTV